MTTVQRGKSTQDFNTGIESTSFDITYLLAANRAAVALCVSGSPEGVALRNPSSSPTLSVSALLFDIAPVDVLV